ncbi:ABC transporter permease [Paenibacillus zanthoxyli]|uniref:ABC transporter permease n=1 Tax=Paenibacillus zanthoxyli TaxID=369399 RepID=UPI00046F014C|nr:ABC transporter permease [Paenibacillus zanthoxyli]
MLKSIHSEWIKSRRTAIPWLLFLAPIAVTGIAALYVQPHHLAKDAWTQMLDIISQLWFAIWFPLAWGLLSGLSAHLESASGGWKALRIRNISPALLYGSKIAVLVIQTLLSTLWLVILTVAAGKMISIPSAVPWPGFIASFVAGWIASLPLLIGSLWLAEGLGWAIAVGFGIVGILIASLIGATSLGVGIWQFILWSWPIRLTYIVYAFITKYIEIQMTPVVLVVFWSVFASSIGLSAILSYFSIKWFHGREVK